MNEINKILILKLDCKLRIFLQAKLHVTMNFQETFFTIKITNEYVYCTIGDVTIFYCETPQFKDINEVDLKSFHNDYLLLVKDAKGISIIRLSTKKLDFFDGAEKFDIDDFLNVGHEQLLIHFGGKKHLVTDFECCYFDTRVASNKDNVGDNSMEDDFKTALPHPSVMSSLQFKISKAVSMGQILESNIREKKDLSHQCWQCLVNLSLDRESCEPKISTLTPIFNKQSPENTIFSDSARTDSGELKFSLVTKWMRRFCSKIVFCFSVKSSCRTIYGIKDVCFSFSNKNKQISSLSSSTSRQFQNYDFWERGSNKDFFVSLDIPSVLIISNLNFNVNLHLNLQNDHIYALHLTTVELSQSDILAVSCLDNKEYHLRDEEDKLTYEFVCTKKCFHLVSKITSLDKVVHIICSRLNCTKLLLGNLTVLITSPDIISGEIRLQNGRDFSQGVIYALSTEQLDVLVSVIQKMLPVDVTFQPSVSKDLLCDLKGKLTKETDEYSAQNSSKTNIDDVIVLDSSPIEVKNDSLKPSKSNIIDTDQALVNTFSL